MHLYIVSLAVKLRAYFLPRMAPLSEHYTPFYEWAATRKDLTLPEALVLCRVKMWGNRGCFEKYSTLAEVLKLSRRKVIQATISLLEKGYIKREYKDKAKQKRILLFDFSKTYLPLIDQKPVQDVHRLSAKEVQTGEPRAPQPVNHVHHTISCTKQEDIINETAEILTDLPTKQCEARFEQSRKRLLKQCEKL